jgi:two-component system response regulator NreC
MSARLYLARDSAEVRADRPIRVVLADDHAGVRRSLRLLLDGEDGVAVVAEAADLSSVTNHVHREVPHVLVLDLRLSDGLSVDAIRRLRERVPETEIVVLTMERSPAFAQRALDAGAVGFVIKDLADAELPIAVRCAAHGEEYVSSHVAAALAGLRKALDGSGLSPRETEVLRLIALGHTTAGIARKLHVSVRTVDSHRSSIHRKLKLRTRAELVQFALARRLLSD